MRLKQCSRCKELKPATHEFYSKNSSKPDGLRYACKVCHNKANKLKYHNRSQEDIVKRSAYLKSYKQQNRERLRLEAIEYRKSNRQSIKEKRKNRSDSLHDRYVKNSIYAKAKKLGITLKFDDIPESMVETQRLCLKIKRATK